MSLLIVFIIAIWMITDAVVNGKLPKWARRALAIAGILFLVWSAASFLLETYGIKIPADCIIPLEVISQHFGAIGLGVTIALFISGALREPKKPARDLLRLPRWLYMPFLIVAGIMTVLAVLGIIGMVIWMIAS